MPAQTLRTLVTGATGYVGQHLVQQLLAQGTPTAALSHSPARAAEVLPPGVTVFGHTHTLESIQAAFERFQPELVIHLATRYDTAEPEDLSALLSVNIQFGVLLAECMRRHGCHYFLNAGTYWQHYGNAAYSPQSRYAACKQAFVDLLRYYCECGDIRAISLELTDIYGPGDPRPRLLNQLRQAALSGETLSMTPGEQIIDLIHVDDVVRAFLHAAECLSASGYTGLQAYGVAGGHPQSLRQLVTRIEALTGQPLPIAWGARPYRSRETLQAWNNPAPLPGWTPRMPLETGLRQVFA